MSGLSVSLNRGGLNTVETDRSTVRATESVRVVLQNHGKPTHVHLRLDDDLATLGTIEDPHWFVPQDEARTVPIRLTEQAEGRGRLEITAGYGQTTTTVDVEVLPAGDAEPDPTESDPGETRPASDGDSNAAETPPESVEPALDSYVRDFGAPAILAGGGAALLVVVLLVVVNPFVALSAGLVAVLSGIAVASYLRDRPDPPETP